MRATRQAIHSRPVQPVKTEYLSMLCSTESDFNLDFNTRSTRNPPALRYRGADTGVTCRAVTALRAISAASSSFIKCTTPRQIYARTNLTTASLL